jgi:hypothetical protein
MDHERSWVYFISKAAVSDRLMILEDELGAVMAYVVYGEDVRGGPYVNVWSGVGTALEKKSSTCHAGEIKCTTSHDCHGEIEKWLSRPIARPRRKANLEPKF